MCNSENEKLCFNDEKNNQKVLVNGGVCLYFSNVFYQTGKNKLSTIKPKLRKILIDYGLCQTQLEISWKLNYIQVWFKDEQAVNLKGLLLQKFNQNKESQAIELSISLEGSLVSSPKISREVKTYSGLTKLLYQEFIGESKLVSIIDDNPFNEIKTII